LNPSALNASTASLSFVSAGEAPFAPAAPASIRPKLAVGSFGPSGSGKTALGATLPGKVGVVPLDSKTRHILLARAKAMGTPADKFLFPKEIV
jgi:hypothetical protein